MASTEKRITAGLHYVCSVAVFLTAWNLVQAITDDKAGRSAWSTFCLLALIALATAFEEETR